MQLSLARRQAVPGSLTGRREHLVSAGLEPRSWGPGASGSRHARGRKRRRRRQRRPGDPRNPRAWGRTARPDPARDNVTPTRSPPERCVPDDCTIPRKDKGAARDQILAGGPSPTDIWCPAVEEPAGLFSGSSSPLRQSRWSLSWRRSNVTPEQMVPSSDEGFARSSILCGCGEGVRTTCPVPAGPGT